METTMERVIARTDAAEAAKDMKTKKTAITRAAMVTAVMRLLTVMAVGGVALVLLFSIPDEGCALWAWVTVFAVTKLMGIVALVAMCGLAAMWADDPLMARVAEFLEEE